MNNHSCLLFRRPRRLCLLTGILLLTGCATTATHPALQAANHLPELIPVRDFVANRGSNWGYQISPDGKKLAWLAIKGVSISIFIKDLEHNSTRTFPAGNFYGFEWAQDSRHLFFMRSQGDENAAYASFDTEQPGDNMQVVFLSPWGGVKAMLLRQIADDPTHVWIVHNQRDKSLFDLYKVNLDTQESVLVAQNPGNATNMLIDAQGVFRGRIVKQGDIVFHRIAASGRGDVQARLSMVFERSGGGGEHRRWRCDVVSALEQRA